MMRSSSQPGSEFARVRQAGVYSQDYKREENIYLFTEMPRPHELADLTRANQGRGCYFFIKDTFAGYFLDPNRNVSRLPIHENEVEKIIAVLPRKYHLNPGVELYLLAEMPTDPLDFVRSHDEKVKDKAAVKQQYTYLLCGEKLYFVDKIENRYFEVKDTPGIKKLISLLGKAMLEPGEWGKLLPELSAAQLDHMPSHAENVQKIKDETLPLQESMDKKKLELLQHAISACPGHTHGEYGIYRMSVDLKDYQDGELIDSLYGADDELSIFETIEKKIDEHLGSEHKMVAKTKQLLQENEIHSGWVLDMLSTMGTKLLETIVHGHGHIPHTGSGAAASQYAMRRQIYKKYFIAPREGLAFPLPDHIPKDQLRHTHEPGSPVEQALAMGHIPTTAEVWVVSSVDPLDIAETGYLPNTHKGLSFVCFTENDAEKLVENIKKFREFNQKLLAFKPFKIDGHHENNEVEAVAAKEILLHAQVICSVFQAVLADYLKTHQDKRDAITQPLLSRQLGSIEFLVKLIDGAMQLEASNPEFKIKIAQINQAIADLTEALQDYVKSHPYQSPEKSFPISLLHHLVQFSESIKPIVAMAELEVKKKAEAHHAHALFRSAPNESKSEITKVEIKPKMLKSNPP